MRTIPGNDHRTYGTPSTWVPLFDVRISDSAIYYLTPNPAAITADGHTYEPFPILLQELVDDGKGEIATVSLTVSNIEGLLGTGLKADPGAAEGQPVLFKIWSVDLGQIVCQESLEIIRISSIAVQSISIDLGMFNPFTVRLLQERFLKDFCWNRYKGAGCWLKRSDGSYSAPAGFVAGSPDSCGKKLADCDRHANVLRFNSFPGIPGGGGYV